MTNVRLQEEQKSNNKSEKAELSAEMNNPNVQKAAEIRNFVSNLRPLSNNSSLSTSNRDGTITKKYKDILGRTKGINLEDV